MLWRSKPIRIAAVFLIVLIVVLAKLYSLYNEHAFDRRARKFHALGSALILYEMNHGNMMPTRLDDLVTTNLVFAQALGPDKEGKERYLYFAKGKNANELGPSDIIAADPYGDSQGGSVLLADGSTLYVSDKGFKYAIVHQHLSPEDSLQLTTDSTRPTN
jgi:hypothetical protein